MGPEAAGESDWHVFQKVLNQTFTWHPETNLVKALDEFEAASGGQMKELESLTLDMAMSIAKTSKILSRVADLTVDEQLLTHALGSTLRLHVTKEPFKEPKL